MFNEESKHLFQSLDLLNIYKLNTYFISLCMFSYFSGTLPTIFEDYFTPKNEQYAISF